MIFRIKEERKWGVILRLKYIEEISKYDWSLSNLIAFLRINLFVKILLTEWLNNPFKPPEDFLIKDRQKIILTVGSEIQINKNLSKNDDIKVFFVIPNLFFTSA